MSENPEPLPGGTAPDDAPAAPAAPYETPDDSPGVAEPPDDLAPEAPF